MKKSPSTSSPVASRVSGITNPIPQPRPPADPGPSAAALWLWLLTFLALYALLFTLTAKGDVTNVEARVTFTNLVRGVTNGDTITIQGDVRRYTNGTLAAAATWIQSTNVPGWAATNTQIHLATYGVTGIDRVFTTNTNAIIIVSALGVFPTVTLSSGVGTVSYATNVWAEATPLLFPNAALYNEAGRTNNASGLIDLINDSRPTNVIANGNPGWTNILDRISQQTASNKVFRVVTNDGVLSTNAWASAGSNLTFRIYALNGDGRIIGLTNLSGTNWLGTNFVFRLGSISGLSDIQGYLGSLTNGTLYSNVLHWSRLTNAVGLHGTVHIFTNGYWTNAILDGATLTNLTLYGNASTPDGAGGFGVNFGTNNAFYESSAVFGFGNSASNHSAIGGINNRSHYNGDGEHVIWGLVNVLRETASFSGAFGSGNTISNAASSYAFGNGNLITNDFCFIFGNYGRSTEPNQVIFAGTTNGMKVEGYLLVAQGLTNMQTLANSTNVIRGDLSQPFATITTVANGANRLNMGTNAIIDITGSPSATWGIDGIIFGSVAPRDGHRLELRNNTGYDATFVHNSGLEATAAYRISTATSTNVIFTNGATASLRYLASASRWVLWSVWDGREPVAAATNAISWLDGSGTNLTVYGSGKPPLRIWPQTGSVSNRLEILTTNGALSVWVDTNATITASNVAATPFGVQIGLPYRIFTVTNTVLVTNATTETAMLSNLLGTATIPANWWTPGRSIHLSIRGRYFSGATTVVTNWLKIGSVTIATNMSPVVANVSGDMWNHDITITCRSVGAAGSIFCQGMTTVPNTAGGTTGIGRAIRLTSGAATVDTTASADLAFNIHPGATAQAFYIEAAHALVIP